VRSILAAGLVAFASFSGGPASAASWSRDLDLSARFPDGATIEAVAAAPDGGAIVAGVGLSNPARAWAARLGPEGSVRWVNAYGPGFGPMHVAVRSDGSFTLVAGSRPATWWRVAADGSLEGDATWGMWPVTGCVTSAGVEASLVRDDDLALGGLWFLGPNYGTRFPDGNGLLSVPRFLAATSDGGWLAGGGGESNGGFVLRFDSDGALQRLRLWSSAGAVVAGAEVPAGVVLVRASPSGSRLDLMDDAGTFTRSWAFGPALVPTMLAGDGTDAVLVVGLRFVGLLDTATATFAWQHVPAAAAFARTAARTEGGWLVALNGGDPIVLFLDDSGSTPSGCSIWSPAQHRLTEVAPLVPAVAGVGHLVEDGPFVSQRRDVVTAVPWSSPCACAAGAPGEVSDVLAGAPPLTVASRGGVVVVESVSSVTYDVVTGRIGAWSDPIATDCWRTDGADAGGGRVAFAVSIPADSWVLVTASNPCGEGPAGAGSSGIERSSGWPSTCGPGP
jgi:hypothetical protein